MPRPRLLSRISSRICHAPNWIVLAGLFFLLAGSAQAGDASHLSGSYQIVSMTNLGPCAQVRLQLNLVNRGAKDLEIQRIAVWDSSRPTAGPATPSAFLLRSGASGSTTSDFLIPTSDLRLWTRGAPLRLVVTVEDRDRRKTTEFIQLDRISAGKAK